MARFLTANDISFFEKISSELVDDVIETTIQFFKLSIGESKTNLYGESLAKSYHQGVNINAVIEREDSVTNYEGFGPDTAQNVEYRFNRHTLSTKDVYPEIGDIIFHNEAYFEISNVREDQMIGGRSGNRFSIICSTFMSRRSQLNLESRIA